MIQPEQVPEGALEAARKAFSVSDLAPAIAAALNAWEGMREQKQGPFGITYEIILPLPPAGETNEL